MHIISLLVVLLPFISTNASVIKALRGPHLGGYLYVPFPDPNHLNDLYGDDYRSKEENSLHWDNHNDGYVYLFAGDYDVWFWDYRSGFHGATVTIEHEGEVVYHLDYEEEGWRPDRWQEAVNSMTLDFTGMYKIYVGTGSVTSDRYFGEAVRWDITTKNNLPWGNVCDDAPFWGKYCNTRNVTTGHFAGKFGTLCTECASSSSDPSSWCRWTKSPTVSPSASPSESPTMSPSKPTPAPSWRETEVCPSILKYWDVEYSCDEWYYYLRNDYPSHANVSAFHRVPLFASAAARDDGPFHLSDSHGFSFIAPNSAEHGVNCYGCTFPTSPPTKFPTKAPSTYPLDSTVWNPKDHPKQITYSNLYDLGPLKAKYGTAVYRGVGGKPRTMMLKKGKYELTMLDSFGDGWSSNYFYLKNTLQASNFADARNIFTATLDDFCTTADLTAYACKEATVAFDIEREALYTFDVDSAAQTYISEITYMLKYISSMAPTKFPSRAPTAPTPPPTPATIPTSLPSATPTNSPTYNKPRTMSVPYYEPDPAASFTWLGGQFESRLTTRDRSLNGNSAAWAGFMGYDEWWPDGQYDTVYFLHKLEAGRVFIESRLGGQGWAPATTTYTFKDEDRNYKTCSVCVYVYTYATSNPGGSAAAHWWPSVNSTIVFDAMQIGQNGIGQLFSGTFDGSLERCFWPADSNDLTTDCVGAVLPYLYLKTQKFSFQAYARHANDGPYGMGARWRPLAWR